MRRWRGRGERAFLTVVMMRTLGPLVSTPMRPGNFRLTCRPRCAHNPYMPTATAVRTPTGKAGEAKSHTITITYPDGTTSLHGGKIAARATHAVVCHERAAVEGDDPWFVENRADQWGHLCLNGRADLAAKAYDKWVKFAAGSSYMDAVLLVEIVEAGS